MAKKRISQVRQEYYKQERRIRNIIKREFKRGITVYEQEILPPRPQRVTKAAVQRLKEITPIVVRSYGTVDVGSVVHTWREVQDASDYQIEQNRRLRKLHGEDAEELAGRPLSTPTGITNRALLGIRKLQERDQAQFARDIEYDEATRYKGREEEYQSIQDIVDENLRKIRERLKPQEEIADADYTDEEYIDEDSQGMGDISAQAREEYEQMMEDEIAYWDRTGLTFEADTIMENLYDAFNHESANTGVLQFLREMTDYRIADLGLNPFTGEVDEAQGRTLLAKSLKENVSDIKSLMNTIVFESDTERIMRATSSMMSLIFDGDVPNIYRTKLDAVMYINMSNIRNKKARKRIINEYYD